MTQPELRESVAQYVRLIGMLTGSDFSEVYMNDLKELCLQDDNIVLVHDLGEAMIEAKISLLKRLWKEIESGLRTEIPDLPAKSKESDISEGRIRRFATGQRSYNFHGLYFGLDKHAKLCVEVEDYIFFGVRCVKAPRRQEFQSLAASLIGWESNDGWPLFRYPPTDLNLKHTSREQLALLVKEDSRRAYVGRWCPV